MENTQKRYNYSIYNIVCKDLDVLHNYVGSTRAWKQRKQCHKKRVIDKNENLYNYPVYECIRQFGGWKNWNMIELEKIYCTKREAELIERKWVERQNADLNNNKKHYITKKESKKSNENNKNNENNENNKEKIIEKQPKSEYITEYREINKDVLKVKAKKKREKYREYNKQYSKNYREQNKEKLFEKFECECGGSYIYRNKAQHAKTKKHQKYLQTIE